MIDRERKISKEIYDRAMETKSHYITDEDLDKVFSMSERLGYGIYGARAIKRDGEYICQYRMGSSCD